MGLSRNKVAVSEGAAGSPPFYGERGVLKQRLRKREGIPGKDSQTDRNEAEKAR